MASEMRKVQSNAGFKLVGSEVAGSSGRSDESGDESGD